MPKAKRLASGNWRALAYVGKDSDGKRQYKSFTAETKKSAELAALEYTNGKKRLNDSDKITFKEASDVYIGNKKNVLSPSTIRGYRIIQKNALPRLLNQSLGRISETDLIQRQLNDNARSYSSKSLRNQLGFITAVMGYFNYSVGKITTKPKADRSILVPTEQDARKIIKLLKSAPDIECQALLALTCSLRQSEIAALHPTDIDGDKAHIHGALVPDETNKLVYKPTNKSSAGTRTVVMSQYLSRRIHDVCKGRKKAEYIFTIPPVGVLERFHKLLKSNDMPPYTIHSLRHCFAAIMHAQNVPDKYIMAMGGWASNYVMQRVYQYTFDEKKNKVQKQANKYFDLIEEKPENPSKK